VTLSENCQIDTIKKEIDMSYNIDRFHVKELKDFSVPIDLLAYDDDHESRGWKVKVSLKFIDDACIVDCNIGCESDGISGKLDLSTKRIAVTSIKVSGESSGTAYHEIMLPLFKASTGRMRAVVVWACGDAVEEITVDNGTIETVDMLGG